MSTGNEVDLGLKFFLALLRTGKPHQPDIENRGLRELLEELLPDKETIRLRHYKERCLILHQTRINILDSPVVGALALDDFNSGPYQVPDRVNPVGSDSLDFQWSFKTRQPAETPCALVPALYSIRHVFWKVKPSPASSVSTYGFVLVGSSRLICPTSAPY